MKHNKKRNTAFLYECLVKELTKAIVRKQQDKKKVVIDILREHFSYGNILDKELQLYTSILENKHKMTDDFSKKFLVETKKDFYNLDRKSVFNAQTKLISQINQQLSSDVFRNFVPNYKNIATVGSWFNSNTLNAKSRLLIETKVLQILIPKKGMIKDMKHIDNLTYKTFTKKFNETYNRSLKENQKLLLTNYITSFSDNGLGLKVFMNEEIGRLRKRLNNIIYENNSSNVDKTKMVLEKLENFKSQQINEEMVKSIFYIQDLVEELDNAN